MIRRGRCPTTRAVGRETKFENGTAAVERTRLCRVIGVDGVVGLTMVMLLVRSNVETITLILLTAYTSSLFQLDACSPLGCS